MATFENGSHLAPDIGRIGRARSQSYNHNERTVMPKDYVEERSGGRYIAGTRVSLASVVFQFRQGAPPEIILQNFPALASLENVYGAITFYLANQATVDAYLADQERKWREFRATADPLPPGLVERLQQSREQRRS